MPITIGHRPSPIPVSNPTDMLLECHDRIRQAMRGAHGLVNAAAADPAVAPTAAAVHRYFAVALPLHSDDEDVSLAPRLFNAGIPDDLAGMLQMMTAQHSAIDSTLERLLPLWDRLQHAPEDLDRLRPELSEATLQLAALWEMHLSMEEQHIFPGASAHLDEPARAAIVEEMRARRSAPNRTNG